jgi:hypothetical protein
MKYSREACSLTPTFEQFVVQLVKGMPARLLKPGSGGPSLERCLKGLYTLKYEEDKDHQLMEAHALSHFDEARPILAAGLYSDCQECQSKDAAAIFRV